MQRNSSGTVHIAPRPKCAILVTLLFAILVVMLACAGPQQTQLQPSATPTPSQTHLEPSATPAPPEARFEASITAGQAPLAVTFSNMSEDADEFQWDFGDGATATSEMSPTHEYTKAGTHTVTLTATSQEKSPESSTATATITVAPGAPAEVTLKPSQVSLFPEETHSFSTEVLDQYDNVVSDMTLTYTSNAEAGQVNDEGVFTAGTKAGTYEEAVTVEVIQGAVAKSTVTTVIINHGPLDRVLLSPETVKLDIGQSQEFSARAVDAYDNPIPEAQLS